MKRGLLSFIAFLFFSQVHCSSLAQEGSCPLFEPEEVPSYIPDARDTLKTRFRERPFASCTFTWKSGKTKEMEIAGQKISVPVEGRLTTTQAQIKSSESDWQRVLASYGSEQLKEIPATGKKAVWSERRGQLSVQGEKHIYHVAVEGVESPLSPMEVAAKVALQLIDQFN